MTDMTQEHRVRFGRRERRGVLFGLNWTQLIALGGVAITVAGLVAAQQYVVLLALALPLASIAVLGGVRVNREPLIMMVLQAAGFTGAKITGQAVAATITDAELVDAVTAAEQGEVADEGELNLPGGLASIKLYSVVDGGAFAYDRKRERFTVTFSCGAPAWSLEDYSDQARAMRGFTTFMNGLAYVPGLDLVDIRARADFSSSTSLQDYAAEQITHRERRAFPPVECEVCGTIGRSRFCNSCGTALRDELVSPLAWSDEQARVAAANVEAEAMEFTYEVTFGFNLATITDQSLRRAVRRAGGGVRGISQVVAFQARRLARQLGLAGVTDVEWMDADAIRASVRLAYDPETEVAKRRRRGGEFVAPTVRPMAAQQNWDHLRIDETYHQVFWITEWPTSDVLVGFLEELVADAGDFTRVTTLQLNPVSKARALKRLQDAQTDFDTANELRAKLGRRETREQRAEQEDVEEREIDVSEGYLDMDFRGFVAIAAGSRDDLDEARNALEVAAQSAQLEARVMYWQQASAFNTAVMPFGLGKVKR